MADQPFLLLRFLVIASLLISVCIACSWLGSYARRHIKKDAFYPRPRTVWTLLFLLIAVLFLKLAITEYAMSTGQPELIFSEDTVLNHVERFMESLLHSIQTFSLGENYINYHHAAQQMFADLFRMRWLQLLLTVYSLALNIAAPLLGGVFLLDVLANVFPRLKLLFCIPAVWREKYFFSELNERSLHLAADILSSRRKPFPLGGPVLIFTNVSIDRSAARDNELLQRAKILGAILLPDDITQLNYKFYTHKTLLLMDEDESENIKSFTRLTGRNRFHGLVTKWIRNTTSILLFYVDDTYLVTEYAAFRKVKEYAERYTEEHYRPEKTKEFRNKADSLSPEEEANYRNALEEAKKRRTYQHLPYVTRVQCYKNMVYTMLQKYPLFMGIDRYDSADLRVSVIGSGLIGSETFFTACWLGQMLDTRLTLDVYSKETQTDFVGKVRSRAPELLESARPGSDLLRIYPDSDPAKPEDYGAPYFSFGYREIDVNSILPEEIACEDYYRKDETGQPVARNLTDSHYIVVAIGSDDENMKYAERLYRTLMIRHKADRSLPPTVIVCVVFDSSLCETVNEKADPNSPVRVYATGSLKERYSYANIFMEEHFAVAKIYSEDYDSKTTDKTRLSQWHQEQMIHRETQLYAEQANLTRALHLSYRIFSAFKHCCKAQASFDMQALTEEYFSLLRRDQDQVVEHLTWLEKRRWNAYMRTQGFIRADYVPQGGKDIALKVHSSLVECKNSGSVSKENENRRDMLDIESGIRGYLLKKYDSPISPGRDKEKKAAIIEFFSKSRVAPPSTPQK